MIGHLNLIWTKLKHKKPEAEAIKYPKQLKTQRKANTDHKTHPFYLHFDGVVHHIMVWLHGYVIILMTPNNIINRKHCG